MFWHVRCRNIIWECYQLWPVSCEQKTLSLYSTPEKAGQLHSFIIGFSNSYLTTSSSCAWTHASTQRNEEWPNTGLLTLRYFVLLWYYNDTALISSVILLKKREHDGREKRGMELDSHLSTTAAFSWALVPHVHSAYHTTAFFFLTTCQMEKQTTN